MAHPKFFFKKNIISSILINDFNSFIIYISIIINVNICFEFIIDDRKLDGTHTGSNVNKSIRSYNLLLMISNYLVYAKYYLKDASYKLSYKFKIYYCQINLYFLSHIFLCVVIY
jgi:hypothetical protein